MSKNNKNKQGNNSGKPRFTKLQEDTSIRLKAFIDDLRRDPMFRHRLFYPVLYKKTVYKSGHAKYDKNNFKGVVTPVAQVIYEYYLFKMESLGDEDDTAKIFQAMLIANGPMLPKKHRLTLKDANASDSLLNRSNMDTVIQRTRIFLDILQDDNLYNFVFMSTVGKDLEDMREKFYSLTTRNNTSLVGANISDVQISSDYKQNLKSFQKYFEHINNKHIREVVHFLVYMGEPRGIVTDFSYRPMHQDELEKYTDYASDDSSSGDVIFRTQIEYALNSSVLQKDLASQLDIFIPVLLNEYTSVCLTIMKSVCTGNSYLGNRNQVRMPRELENSFKLKLQRSIKSIHDYTFNYITRKLLDGSYNNNLFISRTLNKIINDFKNNVSYSNVLRKHLTYSNFTGSTERDLSDLIETIFKNDLEYIIEMCSESSTCQKATGSQVVVNWNPLNRNNMSKTDALDKLKDELIAKAINPLIDYFDTNYKIAESDIKDLVEETLNTKDGYLMHKKASKEVVNDLAAIEQNQNVFTSITNVVKMVKYLFRNKNADDSDSALYESIYYVFYVIDMMKTIHGKLIIIKKSVSMIKDINDLYKALEELSQIGKIIQSVLKGKIKKGVDLVNSHLENSSADIDVGTKFNLQKIITFFTNTNSTLDLMSDITDIYSRHNNAQDFLTELDFYMENIENTTREAKIQNISKQLLEVYFKHYLRPVLINFFSYAFDNFEYTSRQNDIASDVISKDTLHFSKLLDPRNVGLLTFDGEVMQDLAKLTYILTSDQFTGVTYDNPDSVVDFLHKVYGIRYFNTIIYGRRDAYVYLNNTGVSYVYRGAKTKIPINDLKYMYDFLMDPARGLYKNIGLRASTKQKA